MCQRSLVIAILCLVGVAARAETPPGVPEFDGDIKTIRQAAKAVVKHSKECLGAVCVKGNCKAAKQLEQYLAAADAWIEGINVPLERYKKLHLDQALSQLKESGLSQDRVDSLRDLQLLQDSLQAVATAAIEAASWHDFLVKHGEKIGEWWGFWERDAARREQFYKFLTHFYDHLSRINSISTSSKIGADRKQEIGFKDISKFSLESKKSVIELRKLVKEKGFRHKDTRQSMLKLLAKIGDLAVKIDRKRRQARTDKYIRDAVASHNLAKQSVAMVRRINDRIQVAARTRADIRRAQWALAICVRRMCGERAAIGKMPQLKPPGKKKGIPEVLRYFNRNIQSLLSKLLATLSDYRPTLDYQSSVSTSRREYLPHRMVWVNYSLTQCIPRDSRFVVYRSPKSDGAKPILDLGQKKRPKGWFEFSVLEDLSGEWSDRSGTKFEIIVRGKNISLTWPDMPVRGRKRIYKGTLLKAVSEPGSYTLVLHSKKMKQDYLPTNFKIEGQLPYFGKKIRLSSTPQKIDDINPKLPKDIREQLLKEPLKTRLRYKAFLDVKRTLDGKLQLSVEFRNFRFKWGSRDRKIVESSIQEKRLRTSKLNRSLSARNPK